MPVSDVISCVLAVVMLVCFPLCAQEPTVLPPLRVKLTLVPGTKCTTTMRYPSLEKWMASDPRASKIKLPPNGVKRAITFSGEDLSRLTEFSDKSTCEEFIRGKFYLAIDSKRGTLVQELGGENDPGDLDFRKSHFPELDWVGEESNRGIQKIRGTEYLVYEKSAGPSPAQIMRLCADPKTLYPAFFTSFDEAYAYTYSNAGVPAGQKIPLPKNLARVWAKIKADTHRYFKQEISE